MLTYREKRARAFLLKANFWLAVGTVLFLPKVDVDIGAKQQMAAASEDAPTSAS
jgi:hypothetical protein